MGVWFEGRDSLCVVANVPWRGTMTLRTGRIPGVQWDVELKFWSFSVMTSLVGDVAALSSSYFRSYFITWTMYLAIIKRYFDAFLIILLLELLYL